VNVGRIAAVEFEDGPHRDMHLLALHVGGITGNTQSADSHEGRDHCVIPAGTGDCLFVRHEPMLVLSIIAKPLSFRHGIFSAVETHQFVFLASLTACLDSYFLIPNS
jgi:hypothetical protein